MQKAKANRQDAKIKLSQLDGSLWLHFSTDQKSQLQLENGFGTHTECLELLLARLEQILTTDPLQYEFL